MTKKKSSVTTIAVRIIVIIIILLSGLPVTLLVQRDLSRKRPEIPVFFLLNALKGRTFFEDLADHLKQRVIM